MMNTANLSGALLRALCWSVFLGHALPAAAGEIVTCVYLKTRDEHRCIVEAKADETMHLGDAVVAYQKGRYWAGTGKIVKLKGIYSLVSFVNAGKNLTGGLGANFFPADELGQTDWSAAFSHNDHYQ